MADFGCPGKAFADWVGGGPFFGNGLPPEPVVYSRLDCRLDSAETVSAVLSAEFLPLVSDPAGQYSCASNSQPKLSDLGEVIRARKPTRLPVVMTREELKAVLANLTGDKGLMASLMYGAGLRLMECLRLRVQDIDFSRNEILVRDDKGAKDRITMLPESLKTALQDHLKRVKAIHAKDLACGWGRVQMPAALERKCPNAPAEWRWQWVFPQKNRWKNANTGEEGRHHVAESIVQKAFKQAVVRKDAARVMRKPYKTSEYREAGRKYLPNGNLSVIAVGVISGSKMQKPRLSGNHIHSSSTKLSL